MSAVSSSSVSRTGTAVIAVIGLGYVGQPLILGFNKLGFSVLGFDINEELVASLMAGESSIAHIPQENIKAMVDTGRFEATTDFSAIKRADAILICVPTPLNAHREPDLSFITKTATKHRAPYPEKSVDCA